MPIFHLRSYLTHLLWLLKPDPLLHSTVKQSHTHTHRLAGHTSVYIYVCCSPVCLLCVCVYWSSFGASSFCSSSLKCILLHFIYCSTGWMLLHAYILHCHLCMRVRVYLSPTLPLRVYACVYAFRIYACSNLFIVCIFVYIVYRTLNKLPLLLLLMLLLLLLLPLQLQFFRHFLLGVGRFIDWFSSVLRLPSHRLAIDPISIMHAQIIKLF